MGCNEYWSLYWSLVGLQTFRHVDFQQIGTVQSTTSSPILWHCFIVSTLTLLTSPQEAQTDKHWQIHSFTFKLLFYSVSYRVCNDPCLRGTTFSCTSVSPRAPHKPCGYFFLYLVCYHASYWSLHLRSSPQSVNCNYHLAVQKYPHNPCGVEHLRLRRVFFIQVCVNTLLRAC